jgi:hypothetical protein
MNSGLLSGDLTVAGNRVCGHIEHVSPSGAVVDVAR